MEYRNISLSEIASLMKLNLTGADKSINGLNFSNIKSLHNAVLSYSTDMHFTKKGIENNFVKAMFILQDNYNQLTTKERDRKSFFIVDHPETSFYKLHNLLTKSNIFYEDKMIINKISKTAKIHSTVILEENIKIGNNTVIGPYSIIKKNSIIGNNVIISSNVEIGTEGFQVIYDEKNTPYLIKHVGGVKIDDNVSIGTNSTICNSLFEGNTKIGRNTKIDCHVHIAHNCEVGENTIIVDGSILLGTVRIKNNVWIGPNSVIMNKVIVEDNSFVGAASLVGKNVDKKTKVFGIPARKIENL